MADEKKLRVLRPKGLGDKALDVAKGFAAGLTQLPEGVAGAAEAAGEQTSRALEGPSNLRVLRPGPSVSFPGSRLVGAGARRAAGVAGGVRRAVGEFTQENLAGEGLAYQTGQGLGSSVGIGGTAALLTTVGVPPVASVAALGSMLEASSAYREVLRTAKDPKSEAAQDAAFAAFVAGGAIGTTEAVPLAGQVGRFLGRADRATGGALRKALISAGAEATEELVQENVQNVLSDVAARYVSKHDQERDVLGGLLQRWQSGEAWLPPVVAGGLLSAVASAGEHRRSTTSVAGSRTGMTGPEGPASEGVAPSSTTSQRTTTERPASDQHGSRVDALGSILPVEPARPASENARRVAARFIGEQGAQGAVVPPRTTHQRRAAEFFRQRGAEAVFIESQSGELAAPAGYSSGVAVFDANLPGEQLERRLVLHEAQHHLRALVAKDEETFAGLAAELEGGLRTLDPQGMKKIEARVREQYAARGLDEAGVADEVVSNYLEEFGALLFEGARFEQALAQPGLGRRLVDAVLRLIKKAGIKIETLTERRLRKLRDQLAETDIEKGADPATIPAIARTVRKVFDELAQRAVPRETSQQLDAPITSPPAEAAGPTLLEVPPGPEAGDQRDVLGLRQREQPGVAPGAPLDVPAARGPQGPRVPGDRGGARGVRTPRGALPGSDAASGAAPRARARGAAVVLPAAPHAAPERVARPAGRAAARPAELKTPAAGVRSAPSGDRRGKTEAAGASSAEVEVATFDEYAAKRGVPSSAPSFPEAHRAPGGVSKASAKAMAGRIAKASAAWQAQRASMLREYKAAVKAGTVRAPSRAERLTETARGEGPAAEAARRLLERQRHTQALKALRGRLAEAKKFEPKYNQALRQIARKVGTSHPPALPGLKKLKRALAKVMSDYAGDATRIRDLVRGTVVVDTIEQAERAVALLRKRFGAPVKFRDFSMPIPGTGYRDIFMQFERAGGLAFEVQVNVPAMLEAKERMHALYEEWQNIQRSEGARSVEDQARSDQLEAQQREVYGEVWARALEATRASSTTTRSRKASSEMGTPSESTVEQSKRRPSSESQAVQTEDADLDTGRSLQSQKVVPGGNEEGRGISSSLADASAVAKEKNKGKPVEIQARLGRQATVELADGDSLPVTYALVEAEALVPSHDARRGFAPNEGGDLNERPYNDPVEGAPMRETVRGIADRPKVSLLTTDTPSPVDGPPIVTTTGVVLGGNARTMGMQLAYSRADAPAAALRAGMVEAAARFGIDPQGMANPVLVRVVEAGREGKRGELSRVLNESLTTGKGATTEAVSRGQKVTPEVATQVARLLGDGTLREALGEASKANQVARLMIQAGALTQRDLAELFNPTTGIPTAAGKQVIEDALLGSVIQDVRTLSETPPSTRNVLLRSLPSLVTLRGRVVGFDTTMRNVAQGAAEVAQTGAPLKDVLGQQVMPGIDVGWKGDELAVGILRSILSEKPTRISERFAGLAQRARDMAAGQASFIPEDNLPIRQQLESEFRFALAKGARTRPLIERLERAETAGVGVLVRPSSPAERAFLEHAEEAGLAVQVKGGAWRLEAADVPWALGLDRIERILRAKRARGVEFVHAPGSQAPTLERLRGGPLARRTARGPAASPGLGLAHQPPAALRTFIQETVVCEGPELAIEPGHIHSTLPADYSEPTVPPFALAGQRLGPDEILARVPASPIMERLFVVQVARDSTVLSSSIFSVGSTAAALVPSTREQMEAMLVPPMSGDRVMFIHNHPSGDPTVSVEDSISTNTMRRAVDAWARSVSVPSYFAVVGKDAANHYTRTQTVPATVKTLYPLERFRRLLFPRGPEQLRAIAQRITPTNSKAVLGIMFTGDQLRAVVAWDRIPSTDQLHELMMAYGGHDLFLGSHDEETAGLLWETQLPPYVRDVFTPQGYSGPRRSTGEHLHDVLLEYDPRADAVRSTAKAGVPKKGDTPGQAIMFSLGSSWRRQWTSEGNLPRPFFDAKIARDGWINAHLQRSRDLDVDLRRAIKAAWGRPTPAQVEQIDQAFKSRVQLAALPEELRDPVRAMREHVKELSMHLIDSGAIEGELVPTVLANLDFYATRSYRVFDDPKWAERVPLEVRNRAKALLRMSRPKDTDNQIERYINALLYEGKAAQNPIAVLARGGKLGSKDLSITKRREAIAPEIRALFGEYTDARVNYARSVAKMAFLVGNHQFLGEVKAKGLGKFIWQKDDPNVPPEAKATLAADETSVLFPLNGLVTTTDVDQAFRDHAEREQLPAWAQAWLTLNAVAKYGKTVGSVMTQLRNWTGNVPFAMAQGHWRAHRLVDGVRAVATTFHRMNDQTWRDYYRNALRMGVIHESANAGELRAVLEDVWSGSQSIAHPESARGRVRRGLEFLTRVYSAGDDFWKVYAWENEKARYRKAGVFASEAELERETARMVRNTYPTYSLVPRAVRKLRRFPLLGTFVSFPWEVMRTTKNTLALMASELKSSNRRVRFIGAQRLVGSLAAASWSGLLATYARHLLGMTDDEDEEARELLPVWNKNSDILWLGRDEKGNRTFVDLSYTDPYKYLKTPLMALLRGEDWQEKLTRSVGALLEPFMSEELATKAAIDLARNATSEGRRIWNPAAPPEDQLADVVAHIGKALEPGTLTSLRRIYLGTQGKVVGTKAYDPRIETLAMTTGVRVSSLDLAQGVSYKARDFEAAWGDATRMLTGVVGHRGQVSDAEVEEAYRDSELVRRKAWDRLQKAISAARALGLVDRELLARLEPNLGKARALEALRGRYAGYSPSSSFLSIQSRGASASERREFLRRGHLVRRLALSR